MFGLTESDLRLKTNIQLAGLFDQAARLVAASLVPHPAVKEAKSLLAMIAREQARRGPGP